MIFGTISHGNSQGTYLVKSGNEYIGFVKFISKIVVYKKFFWQFIIYISIKILIRHGNVSYHHWEEKI